MDPTMVHVSRRHRPGACVFGWAHTVDSVHVRVVMCRRAGALGNVCAPVGRLGEPDAEPTRGDKGVGNTASRSRRHAAMPPHDCISMGGQVGHEAQGGLLGGLLGAYWGAY